MADNNTEYPKVLYKQDPLMVRIDELTLLVGSTSYKAKLKLSAKFDGFYIYVSGLGEPILKQPVDVGENSREEEYDSDNNPLQTDNEGNPTCDAKEYIREQAMKWLTALQDSFLNAKDSKNVVEVLQEMKCQNHYDITGDTTYIKENMDVCVKDNETSLKQLFVNEMTTMQAAMQAAISALTEQVKTSCTAMQSQIDALEERLANEKDGILTVGLTNLMVGDKSKTAEAHAQIIGNIIADRLCADGSTVGALFQEVMNDMIDHMDEGFDKVMGSLGLNEYSDNMNLHSYIKQLSNELQPVKDGGSIYTVATDMRVAIDGTLTDHSDWVEGSGNNTNWFKERVSDAVINRRVALDSTNDSAIVSMRYALERLWTDVLERDYRTENTIKQNVQSLYHNILNCDITSSDGTWSWSGDYWGKVFTAVHG